MGEKEQERERESTAISSCSAHFLNFSDGHFRILALALSQRSSRKVDAPARHDCIRVMSTHRVKSTCF